MCNLDKTLLSKSYIANRNDHPVDLIILILDNLNSVLIRQVDILHTKNIKIKGWQHPFEALSFKLSSHIASLQKLLSKSSIPYYGQRLDLIDIASVNIITRAIIENYLTLYHFHYDSVAEEQKAFRYLIYVISALRNRQIFSVYNLGNQQQLDSEKIVIQELIDALKLNTYFIGLPLKNQTHYLQTKEAKQLNWTDLLDKSDLKPEFFKDTWRLLSNYAHSEFLGVLQIRDYPKNPKPLNDNAYFMAELSAMIIGRTITNNTSIFPVTKEVVDNLDDDAKNLLQYFSTVGTKENNIT